MIFKLLRVHQWYKNLLVFLPIIFSGNFFNLNFIFILVLGFFALCFVSSSQYIINDIIDVKKDRLHPEKRNRPIASGKIKKIPAFIFSLFLLVLGIFIGFLLNFWFGIIVCSLFILSLIYSLWLKHEVIADVLVISINFVLRAVSGTFLIHVFISPWLIIGVFFFALFLVVGKRYAEVLFFKEKAVLVRKSLKGYNKDLSFALMIISTVLLIMCYALYSFFSEHQGLFITLPFAFYAILRYFTFIIDGNKIARNPETAITDPRLLISVLLWVLTAFLILYRTEFSFLF